MDFSTPRSILNSYKKGLLGGYCDPEETADLLGRLLHPVFGASAYSLYGTGEGKLSLPFKSLLKYVPDFGPSEAQTDSDCVSHSTRNAVDITRAVEIDIHGEAEEFEARGATEAIYQSRGHKGQGMSCSTAAKYVESTGGVLLRRDYGDINLSKYNADVGARHRVPRSIFSTEAQKHQIQTISLISTVEEARDALANGYGISACSGHGFSSRRDQHGIAKRSGGWNHAMCWIACDDTKEIYNETLFLVQNSWGLWNAGPKRHGQPDGSFWIREKDARAMLSGRGSWVFSNFDGFPARDLPDFGTHSFL